MSKRELHLARLRRGLEMIDEFRNRDARQADPEFDAWRHEMVQSLDVVLPGENYSNRLANTSFNDYAGSYNYDHVPEHQKYRLKGLRSAELILRSAIEEAELGPEPQAGVPTQPAEPSVVVNVQNVLTQSMHVELSQISDAIDRLDLSPPEKERAKSLARNLQAEATGEQRWPVLAKSLDGLRSLGKSAYKEVAIPLLLELLKKQAGL